MDSRNAKVFIVSHFLPVTLAFNSSQTQLFLKKSNRSKERTESSTATAPPSRYHFRSDSDPGRLPCSPRPSMRSPTKGRSPRSISFSSTEWSIEGSKLGNIGLFNAINAMNDDEYQRLYVGQLGCTTEYLARDTKAEINETLYSNNKCIPVYVSDTEAEGHYNQFCKEVLWPTMHYILPDYLKTSMNEKTSWDYYVSVNERFADEIVKHYRPGDLVWVHDYHLLLLPSMLRKLIPEAKIGFFLHIPFPSSEVFRCLHGISRLVASIRLNEVRKQLLEGLLSADLIGFQTYSFARHFLQTCTRILGYESTPKGLLLKTGKLLPVEIFPIGIDTPTLNNKLLQPEVVNMIDMLKEKYSGKRVIVARDKLDPVKGVRQKLFAFELFLSMFPNWQGRVVLIQVGLSTTEHLELQRQVSDLAARINSRFGSIEYTPVVYLHQDISFSHYLALLSIADACLITSLRDGMNLTSHEYIACQESSCNPLIISEFTGTYGSFGSAIRINPWDYHEVANSINEALNMPNEEKVKTHRELYRHVVSNTGSYWAKSFISELKNIN